MRLAASTSTGKWRRNSAGRLPGRSSTMGVRPGAGGPAGTRAADDSLPPPASAKAPAFAEATADRPAGGEGGVPAGGRWQSTIGWPTNSTRKPGTRLANQSFSKGKMLNNRS